MKQIPMSSPTETLKNFMQEFFDFDGLLEAGLFTKEMRGDYQAQADRVCQFLGLNNIYEYGVIEGRAHISYSNTDGKSFVEVFKNIYEEG